MSNKWSIEIQYKPILSIIFNYIENWDFWLLVDISLLHNDRVFADFIYTLLNNEVHKDLFKITTAAIGKPEIEKVVRNRFISSLFHKKEWFMWNSFIELMKTEKDHLSIRNNYPIKTIPPEDINKSYVYKISKETYKSNKYYYGYREKCGEMVKYDINDCIFVNFIDKGDCGLKYCFSKFMYDTGVDCIYCEDKKIGDEVDNWFSTYLGD